MGGGDGALPKDRSFVDDVARNSLSDFDSVGFFDKITIHRSAAFLTFHRLQAAHSAILLQSEKMDQQRVSRLDFSIIHFFVTIVIERMYILECGRGPRFKSRQRHVLFSSQVGAILFALTCDNNTYSLSVMSMMLFI